MASFSSSSSFDHRLRVNGEEVPLLSHTPTAISTMYSSQPRTARDVTSSGSQQTAQSPTASFSRPIYPEGYRVPTTRLGPQRTSFTTQKLKLLPDEPLPDNQQSDRDVYSQVTRIKETPARKDAERLGKAHRALLPRVTAYCSASSYRMKDLVSYISSRKAHNAAPKLFDECLYTTYSYNRISNNSDSNSPEESLNGPARLIRLDDEGGEIDVELAGMSDVFLFEYGVVVFWGFNEAEEKRFLKEIAKFENEKLAEEDVQVEEFNYYITKSYQPRVC